MPGPFAEKFTAEWLENISSKGVTAVVYCPDRTSWEDAYTSPVMAKNLRNSVIAALKKNRWRTAAVFPPLNVYTRD